MNKFLEAALKYCDMGFSVIPVLPKSKKPLVKWEEYQKRIATKDEIESWWDNEPNANVGIVTGKLSGIAVIDLDKYAPDYNEQITLECFPDSIVTPSVATPRGGQHLYFQYPDIDITINARAIPGIDLRGEGGFIVAPPSLNGDGKPYAWIDGLEICPPQAMAIMPLQYINKVLYKGNTTNVVNNTTNTTQHYKILQKGHRDSDLFSVANALIKSGVDEGFTRQVLEILSKNSNPPFPQDETEVKILSALQRAAKRERNLAQEVREWILLQEGNITATQILQMLHITTKEEKKNLTVILSRLQQEGIIEKNGDNRGNYRTKTINMEKMDLQTEEDTTEVDVKLPLNLNDMCVISPGNIIVVAGSKSSGKTAFMLNVAMFNQNEFEIVYLNSEMHQAEFKKRLKKIAPLSDWKITGYKCHNNFDDYVDGDKKKIFIVDYLEVHDNFFEIAKPIRKIHEKLGDAICFIAIQMKTGGVLGRGGDFSAEKARLYLTMDYDQDEKMSKVSIYDAKEPRPPHDNVRGKWRRVKIINGSKMSSFDNWKW